VRIRTTARDQIPIGIIETEEPLHLGRRRVTGEGAIGGGLLVAEELHRHESRP